METDEAEVSSWAPPSSFPLRLPPHLHRELHACSFDTGISINELIICAVERLMSEARVDLKVVIENVTLQKAERFRQESLGRTTRLAEAGLLWTRGQNNKG
jgi:hypothetical protein